jgi:DNA/RNA endonuclease G (NUC1)
LFSFFCSQLISSLLSLFLPSFFFFTQGHLAPAANFRDHGQKAIDSSFILSNISPQHPALNREYWSGLERFARHTTRFFDEVFVLTGPLFLPTHSPVSLLEETDEILSSDLNRLRLSHEFLAEYVPMNNRAQYRQRPHDRMDRRDGEEEDGGDGSKRPNITAPSSPSSSNNKQPTSSAAAASSTASSAEQSTEGATRRLRSKRSKHWRVDHDVLGDPPRLPVPTHFFKVLVGVKEGQEPQVASFVLPNRGISFRVPLSAFTVSLDTLDKLTGFNVFPKLDRAAIRPMCDSIECRSFPFRPQPHHHHRPGPSDGEELEGKNQKKAPASN